MLCMSYFVQSRRVCLGTASAPMNCGQEAGNNHFFLIDILFPVILLFLVWRRLFHLRFGTRTDPASFKKPGGSVLKVFGKLYYRWNVRLKLIPRFGWFGIEADEKVHVSMGVGWV